MKGGGEQGSSCLWTVCTAGTESFHACAVRSSAAGSHDGSSVPRVGGASPFCAERWRAREN